MSRRRRDRLAARTFAKRRAVRGLRFESLEQRAMLAADFGDAASAIGGAYASASHEAVGPKLGVLRDANSTSVANVMANGDASDEEGVVFSVLRAGQSAVMTVHVSNAPAGALLYAAIDFNRDNDWVDADERIAFNAAVVEGDNVLNFTVPVTVTGGHYYARVRLSTASNLSPFSVAPDGEVEDYLVPIAHADSGPFGGQQPLSFNDASRIVPTDLDGDGDLDLLTSRSSWLQSINGRYAEEALLLSSTGSNLSTTTTALAPADVDGDGDMDFFAGLASSGGVSWYENDGNERFTRRSLETGFSTEAIAATDLDGDGDLDLVSAAGGAAHWYVNDGAQAFSKVAIPGSLTSVRSLVVDDMDGDGDLDIVAASSSAQTIKWLENDGSQQFTVRDVDAVSGSRSVATGDLDGDGDIDMVAAYIDGYVIHYENNGDESFVANNLDVTPWGGQAAAVAIADLDGDGDLDVAASGMNRVAWYENDGDGAFSRRIISTVIGLHLDVAAADLDGDGRLDLITTGTGTAPIAWYPQLAEYDYGDAPSPYRVYNQQNGPRHNAVGPRLGATRDAEADASRAPAGAEAEDDGVVFGALSLSESTGTVTVNVQNAPAGAKLDAWIDFNADGTWGSEGEQIARSFAVVEGDNTLTFAIPQWAVAGATYARFRLSTAGDLNPQGVALDGEVEDYPVTLANRAAATGFFEEPKLVGSVSSPFGGAFVVTSDVDGDGDVDVVSKGGQGFVWAENIGPNGFVTHTVAAPGLYGEDITTGDLDSDGDVDFVGFGYVQQKRVLLWAENDGQQNFTLRTFVLTNGAVTFVALTLADVDSDGDIDILAASLGEGVYAFVNNGRQEFTTQFIGHLGYYATSVVAADMDRDGDLDVVVGGIGVLSGGVLPHDVAWFQNNGGLTFSSLRGIQRRTLPGLNNNGATESVAVGDIDGDGDFDVVSAGVDPSSRAGDATLWWHEQLADQTFVSHAIDYDRNFRWATLGDFDADGYLDVVATGYTSSVDLYENIGGQSFFKRQISVAANDGMSSSAADMDNDGDLDLVAMAVPGNYNVSWFENINLVDPDYGDAPAPYPSTRSQSGAAHVGVGPRLGASRTSEADGTPTPNADGDSGDDGVAFSPIQVGQSSATVTANVQNAPAGAKLDAWIDFNGDGFWGGAGEQIFASYSVVEGDNVLAFAVPANIVAGSVVARFRLSTAGGLRPGGVSLDGEVEDYRLVVGAPDRATGEYQTAAYIAGSAVSIRIADIDGDGDADYLTVGQGSSPPLAWHENLGDGAYLTHAY